MQFFKKTLTLVLTFLIVFTSCSAVLPVLATNEDLFLADSNADLETATESEPEIISEITEKREENTKHFLMSDGSFIVAQYPNAVHFLDENGVWQDIDNTVSETVATSEQTLLFGTDEIYSTNKAVDNIVFAEKSNSNTLVSYEAKDFPISFNYQSAKKSNINITQANTELTGNDAFLTLQDVTEEVTYEDVFYGVDLQYIVTPGALKENIILKSKNAENAFTVNYNIGTLAAKAVDSKTIHLMNGEDVIYVISAPYMSDSAGAVSESVSLKIEKNKNGKLRVVITADDEWLQESDRVYPVTVDPTITTEITKEAVDSVFVAGNSAYANVNMLDMQEMLVGRETSKYGYCHSLFKFELPTLNKGDMVVSAMMNVVYYAYDVYSEDETPDMQVNAHILEGSWNKETVTWNNCPSYSSTVLDYCIFNRITEAKYVSFDITSVVKQWYEGTSDNYGILLKPANETGTMAETGFKAAIWTERYNTTTNAYPHILLAYRNNKGLEDYWTYTSLSAGNAGSAYINDYTGNLVFAANLFSSSNEIMPLSVDCVYNGYCSTEKYVSGKASSNLTVPGKGWRLSVQQTLLPSPEYGLTGDSADMYPYVYTDGDGTEHYIYKKTENEKTTYEDEDGLGLTLTFGSKDDGKYERYYLTDKKDNKLVFNKKGNLIASKDPEGNKVAITYDANETKILSVTDGAGLTYEINYETNSDYIANIKNPSGQVIDFTYSSGYLIEIAYPNNNVATFTYDSEHSLETATDESAYQLKFAYTSAELGKRVRAVVEYGNGSRGQKITFDRSQYNTTAIRTAGTDGVFENGDDLITTYKFDNFGKTVTQQLKTASGTHSVAGVYNYSEKDTSQLKTANKVTSSASLGKNVVNHVVGSNAESTYDWTAGDTNNGSTQYDVSSTYSYIGNKSLYVKNTAVNSQGDKGYWYQNITGLTAGATYTLSAYVKTKDLEIVNGGSTAGAYIFTRYTNAENELVYNYSEYLDTTTSVSVNKGWRKLSATVNLPSGVSSLRVYLGFKDAKGTAYFDCIQLEASSVANDYNLIENASFEKTASGMPKGWSTTTSSYQANGTTVNEGVSEKHNVGGSKSFVIEGEASQNKNIYQDIPVYGSKDDTYIVSGWGRANAIKKSDNHENTTFGIKIRVYYTDSNGNTVSEYKTPAEFNADVSGWQYTAQTFVLKHSEHDYQPTKVRIILSYDSQVNYGYFDNIQLIKDVASSYTYDKEGNVVSVSANAEQKDDMTYDGSDLKTYTDVLGNKTTYTYDDKHNLTTAKTPGNVHTSFSYNSKGQQTSSEITNTSKEVAIKTETVYTNSGDGVSAGAYVAAVSDENGFTTSYSYDMKKGLTTSVTNANSVSTNYVYSEHTDRLKSVSSSGSSVSYTYDKDRLSTITFGSDVYSFVYDSWGNAVSTKINGKALSTNTYGANNGVLEKTTYGNGAVKQYAYDEFGNLKTVKDGNGNSLFAWYYDSSMTPLVHSDVKNNLKYYYGYDSIGRLITQEVTNRNTGAHVGSFEYTYDLRNNITDISTEFGGRTITQSYVYSAVSGNAATERYGKDNLPVRYNVTASRFIDYTYDTINRLQKKTLSTDDPYVVSYSYKTSQREKREDGTSYRTTQISTEVNGERAFVYNYDSLGNITNIYAATADGNGNKTGSNTGYRSYAYDGLNQLIRENNKSAGETYIYTYDSVGNITSKKVYDYTGNDISSLTPKQTITYTYGADSDAGWKKLLTNYNGEAIDYDAIGNPTTYRGATLTWEGRELKKFVEDGTTIKYTYDADGLRGSKTIGSAKTTYHYVGGQLLYEDRNGTDIYYYYDSNGVISAIRYSLSDGSTKTMFVSTNALGDVIGLYGASGNQLVKYEYDAWGKVISETDANGNALTGTGATFNEINPFRYRGYYYDSETGLYYLQSRYYDPEVGRFVNSDACNLIVVAPTLMTDKNYYTYCDNNPICRKDPTGTFWTGIVVGAVVGGITSGITGGSVLGGIVGGAVSGFGTEIALWACATAGFSAAVAFGIVCVSSSAGSAAGSYISQRIDGVEDINWGSVIVDGIFGLVDGVLAFGLDGYGMDLPDPPILEDIINSAITSFGSWYNSSKMQQPLDNKSMTPEIPTPTPSTNVNNVASNEIVYEHELIQYSYKYGRLE